MQFIKFQNLDYIIIVTQHENPNLEVSAKQFVHINVFIDLSIKYLLQKQFNAFYSITSVKLSPTHVIVTQKL